MIDNDNDDWRWRRWRRLIDCARCDDNDDLCLVDCCCCCCWLRWCDDNDDDDNDDDPMMTTIGDDDDDDARWWWWRWRCDWLIAGAMIDDDDKIDCCCCCWLVGVDPIKNNLLTCWLVFLRWSNLCLIGYVCRYPNDMIMIVSMVTWSVTCRPRVVSWITVPVMVPSWTIGGWLLLLLLTIVVSLMIVDPDCCCWIRWTTMTPVTTQPSWPIQLLLTVVVVGDGDPGCQLSTVVDWLSIGWLIILRALIWLLVVERLGSGVDGRRSTLTWCRADDMMTTVTVTVTVTRLNGDPVDVDLSTYGDWWLIVPNWIVVDCCCCLVRTMLLLMYDDERWVAMTPNVMTTVYGNPYCYDYGGYGMTMVMLLLLMVNG